MELGRQRSRRAGTTTAIKRKTQKSSPISKEKVSKATPLNSICVTVRPVPPPLLPAPAFGNCGRRWGGIGHDDHSHDGGASCHSSPHVNVARKIPKKKKRERKRQKRGPTSNETKRGRKKKKKKHWQDRDLGKLSLEKYGRK